MIGAALRFEQVTKQYGGVAALSGFDLTLKPGEFMTLLGASGSGKTTALNIVAGFTSATSGDVKIDGKSVLGLPSERRNIGMVFQNYSLFPHLSVFENVAFPLRLRKVRGPSLKKRVSDALEMVQLAGYGARMPKELSGGQRQRIAFARAVIFEPPVLLMDEPLGALDLKLREQMQAEIKRYHSQLGCTIVFVTHDQGEALTLSDRIAVMRNGRIEQVGSPQEIYDRPDSKYVAEFVGRTNLFAVKAEQDGAVLPELGAMLPSGGYPTPCHLSVRPEKIRLSRRFGSDHGVAFTATLQTVLFLGDHVQYDAITPNGKQIVFQERRDGNSELLKVGEALTLSFRSEDAVLVS